MVSDRPSSFFFRSADKGFGAPLTVFRCAASSKPVLVVSGDWRIHPDPFLAHRAVSDEPVVHTGSALRQAIDGQHFNLPPGAAVGIQPNEDHRGYRTTADGAVIAMDRSPLVNSTPRMRTASGRNCRHDFA